MRSISFIISIVHGDGRKRARMMAVAWSAVCFFIEAFAGQPVVPLHGRTESALHILALRVEFQPDAVATTTGDGRFDLSASSNYHLDRPPHDRLYFQHQLMALANYYHSVSRGKVTISGDVYPLEDNASYQLPHEMTYYSGQENAQLQQKGWAELLRDALVAAAASGEIDFSAYNCLIVFHAGVGQDFAFDFDTTPYDIQSAYIDFFTLQQGLAPNDDNFQGIPVPGGVFIRDGIILPETQNQEGYDLGLLGTMTLLTGSRLGMPSLFDTRSGRAGIGRWGLMDQGSFNFQGFIPSQPCAWEKVYMGWETPLTVRNGEDIRIGSSKTITAPHIFKVPITEEEYFLIENRQRDLNGDHIAIARDENGRKAEFDSTGRVVAPADIGVLTRIDEYDYGLPGAGILIWHIDERVIAAGLATNTVNINRDHRGVDLVECDGAQDIGYLYDMFDAAYGTENGDYWDAYWRSNQSHKIVNDGAEVAFSPVSIPNSNAHGGAKTHIRIDGFSERDTIMTFDVHSDFSQPGFPQPTASTFSTGALLATTATNGHSGILLAVAKDGTIFAWLTDGSPLFPAGKNNVATTPDSVNLPPIFGDVDADGVDELVVADIRGNVSGWQLRDSNGDQLLDQLFNHHLPQIPSAGPMLLTSAATKKSFIVLGDRSGACHIASSLHFDPLRLGAAPVCGLAAFGQGDADFIATTVDGTIFACRLDPPTVVWQRSLPSTMPSQPLTADFDGQPGWEIAVMSQDGALTCFSNDGGFCGAYRPPLAESFVAAPAIGDIDADGLPEILCTTAYGLLSLEFTGATTANFPAPYPTPGKWAVGPLWRQTMGAIDGRALVPVNDFIYAFDAFAKKDADFPITAGAAIVTTPVLADLDGDNRCELAAINEKGELYVWKTYWKWDQPNAWSHHGGSQRRDFHWAPASSPLPSSSDWLPAQKVFCYPNPVEDGHANIHFTLTKAAQAVTVHFYTLAGRVCGKIQVNDLAIGDHELVWEVDRIQSGVYMARVEAIAEGEHQVRIIKIAVIK